MPGALDDEAEGWELAGPIAYELGLLSIRVRELKSILCVLGKYESGLQVGKYILIAGISVGMHLL